MLNIIYYNDEKCVICNKKIYDGDLICKECSYKVKRCLQVKKISINKTILNIYSAAYYSNIIKEMIARLKYKSDFKCGYILSEYMIDTINNQKIKYDILTYIPVSRKVMKKRGYNQSEYLARKISYKYNKQVIKLLKKVKETKDQIGLDKEERWNNIMGSFIVVNENHIKNKSILIIDDVVTTGATVYCAALQLLNNGAKNVTVLTAAKSKI
ncbi:ComF family protein [Haloimpatiens sp. FM7330]|uniref:ComF family protein n=1 Tax=Haloimpatiens sp. FM7330 TaxID=3298610 RepID=UPI003645A4EA